MKSITIEHDVYSGQTGSCAACLHIGYTRILWHPRWAKGRDAALVIIRIAAPKQDPDKGYMLTKWGIRFYRNRRKKTAR